MRSISLILAALTLVAGSAAAAPAPPSAADLTKAPAIQDVSLSPDGKHMVALTSPDGEALDITVWSTVALSAQPTRVGSKFMRFLGVSFLKNDRLLVTAVQPLTIQGTPQHLVKQYITDLEGKSFTPLLPDRSVGSELEDSYNQLRTGVLISTLPKDPRHVLVEDERLDSEGDVDAVDVYDGTVARVMKGSEKYDGYLVDMNGEVRARSYLDTDDGKVFIGQQYRDSATGEWVDLFRSYGKDRDVTSIVGFTADPNVILIQAYEGADKAGIFEYDVKLKKIIEPAFQHKMFDARSVVFSRAAQDNGQLLGFRYAADTTRVYWIDGHMAALQRAAEHALGVADVPMTWVDPGTGLTAKIPVASGATVDFISRSDDFRFAIFEKSGPRQPPEYYLLADGKMSLLGKSRPWIDPSSLGDTKLVEYPARDGLMIPAFLTTPPASFGPGPYPTLIEPHGGPWARDELDWDVTGWIQYFASRGYAVLQPQFRGSEGWGARLWRAGDREWGQKMQDDNDDGVKWLIAQKIADPKRVAIFGYSYGGYAALAASIRPNGLYQCAISGAGAGDLSRFVEATYDSRFGREYQMPTVAGLNPLEHVRDVQIPVLLYTGDHDVTVDPVESRSFAAQARAAGKDVRLVEIHDMGHQITFWTPDMATQQLNLIDGYLKTGCKPGGL
ncbi:MAG TPA: prolyl oligopeptidase family serine peptidase [Caulobacteraceae bacterium]|nr:prolyl oligopeptidase family serine peptidase [Caulobacteraceae bacterium]